MKIVFDELASKNIQALIIQSLDCSLYRAIVVIDNDEYVVYKDDKPFVRRNLVVLREAFAHLRIERRVLRQESAYDEMVGQAVKSSSNRLEVPLGKNTYAELSYE